MTRCTVRLNAAAGEMAREEIGKQAAFLSKSIGKVSFSEDGSTIEFDAADAEAADMQTALERAGNRIVRSLRSLERKVVFASTASPPFPGNVPMDGVHFLGTGQVALSGTPLRLFEYFDRVFEAFGKPWRAEPLRTPTLIPSPGLSRCDYFRSFPHNVTFATHLREESKLIDAFRSRHQDANDVDDMALADMDKPEAC